MPEKKNTKNKNNKKNSNSGLSEELAFYLKSPIAAEINAGIAAEHELTVGQLARMTELISSVYDKKMPPANLPEALKNSLEIEQKKAQKIAKEIAGKRLLVVDELAFGGQIAKLLQDWGGQGTDYEKLIEEYKDQVERDKQKAEDEKLNQEYEQMMVEKQEQAEEAVEDVGEKLTDALLSNPEKEKKQLKDSMKSDLLYLLTTDDYKLKAELNYRIAFLVAADDEGKFVRDLTDELYKNKEILTETKVQMKDEKLPGTIGNWLKDYVAYVGLEETVSSIKKAQYFTEAPNAKKLKQEEKNKLDNLLDFFVNLQKVYTNISKYDLSEVQILPISEAERAKFIAEIEQAEQKKITKTSKVKKTTDQAQEDKQEIDIGAMYEGDPDERLAIDKHKKDLITETRKEYHKIADKLEDYLLRRKRVPILASLELLAEIGALDNLLANDQRYQDFLFGYLKRNNMSKLQDEFKANPYQSRFLKFFLRFVLEERLGIREEEAARIAAKLSMIFQEKGAEEYGEMAYLDLAEGKFKWSE